MSWLVMTPPALVTPPTRRAVGHIGPGLSVTLLSSLDLRGLLLLTPQAWLNSKAACPPRVAHLPVLDPVCWQGCHCTSSGVLLSYQVGWLGLTSCVWLMRGLSTGFLCQAPCSLACFSGTDWPHKVVTGSVYWVWQAPPPLSGSILPPHHLCRSLQGGVHLASTVSYSWGTLLLLHTDL